MAVKWIRGYDAGSKVNCPNMGGHPGVKEIIPRKQIDGQLAAAEVDRCGFKVASLDTDTREGSREKSCDFMSSLF